MRKLIAIATLAIMVFTTADAHASRRPLISGRPAYNNGGGAFSRLMEFERRKNAAIFGMIRR